MFQPTYTETAEPDASIAQPENSQTLTTEEMQRIRGKKIVGVNFKKFIRWVRRFNPYNPVGTNWPRWGETFVA